MDAVNPYLKNEEYPQTEYHPTCHSVIHYLLAETNAAVHVTATESAVIASRCFSGDERQKTTAIFHAVSVVVLSLLFLDDEECEE